MSLRDDVRAYLGTDHIRNLEDTMAKVIDLLNNLAAQQEAASAAQASSFHNIDAAFAKLQDAINNGNASPEVQAAADQLAAGFNSLQKAAEDEGRLYEEPSAPVTPPGPVDPGTEPTNPDVPADGPANASDTTVPGDETGPTVRSNRR